MKHFLSLTLLFVAIPLLAQESNLNFDQRKQELINVDTQFSKFSEASGVNEAFLSYIADDGCSSA